MAEKKKGIIHNMIIGKERDEDYARSTLPTNRWSLFWDILKNKLSKLCIINLLMFLFLLPVAVLLYFRFTTVIGLGMTLPFNGGLGVGFPGSMDVNIQYLSYVASLDNTFFLLCIPACVIAGIGFSGGFYIMRNIVWTEGTFVANDFWRGIKTNIVHFLFIGLIIGVVLFIGIVNFNLINLNEYTAGASFWTVAARVSTWIMFVIVFTMCLYMMTLTVTYKLKFHQLIKNAFILTVGLFFQNIFFIALGLVPFLVCYLMYLIAPSTFIISFVLMIFLLIGVSIFVLVWTNYNQWAFDKFLNDRVDGAVKNKGIFPKVKDDEIVEKRKKAQAVKFENPKKKRAVKPVTDRNVRLTDISGGGFTRENIAKLEKEKEKLKVDADAYAEDMEKNKGEVNSKPVDIDIKDLEDDSDDNYNFEGYEEAMKLEGYEGDMPTKE